MNKTRKKTQKSIRNIDSYLKSNGDQLSPRYGRLRTDRTIEHRTYFSNLIIFIIHFFQAFLVTAHHHHFMVVIQFNFSAILQLGQLADVRGSGNKRIACKINGHQIGRILRIHIDDAQNAAGTGHKNPNRSIQGVHPAGIRVTRRWCHCKDIKLQKYGESGCKALEFAVMARWDVSCEHISYKQTEIFE